MNTTTMSIETIKPSPTVHPNDAFQQGHENNHNTLQEETLQVDTTDNPFKLLQYRYYSYSCSCKASRKKNSIMLILPKSCLLFVLFITFNIHTILRNQNTVFGYFIHSMSKSHHHTQFWRYQSSFANNLVTSSTSSYTLSSSSSCNYSYHSTKQRSLGILYMAKGDGKQKRKKKSSELSSSSSSQTSSSPSSSSSSSSSSPPQRVSNDINIPVRQQIMWAQLKKEAERNSGTSFRQTNIKRTAYRKSLDECEIEEAKLERQRKGQEPDWDVILNATSTSPLVIIDAYNIIHKWPRLKKWMNKGMLSKARELFIHDLEELRMLKGWRIECVFDGYGKSTSNSGGVLGDGPGSEVVRNQISKSEQQASKKVTDFGVRVVFSGAGTSADGYIESRCFDAKAVTEGKLTGSLIVASDDALIRCAASNAGALCMSADRLINELKAMKLATMHRVEVAVAKVNGHDVRPVQLRDKVMPNLFNKGNLIIEDKRNRPKKSKKKDDGEKTMTLEDMKEGTNEIPSWAIVPPKNVNNNM